MVDPERIHAVGVNDVDNNIPKEYKRNYNKCCGLKKDHNIYFLKKYKKRVETIQKSCIIDLPQNINTKDCSTL
jgi:hypothetical protein